MGANRGQNNGTKRLKLTRRVQERIVKAISSGSSLKIAHNCAGVPSSTFYRWMKRGEEGDGEIFVAFRRAVLKAENEHFERMAQIVTEAADESWHAAAWMLERRNRDDFGKYAPPPKVDKLLQVGLVLFDKDEEIKAGALLQISEAPLQLDDGDADADDEF